MSFQKSIRTDALFSVLVRMCDVFDFENILPTVENPIAFNLG
jgi:hypothetical protein